MDNYDYDLFVIGTGDAGSSAAKLCARARWRVAIADERPFGGTCPLRGCNPKRALTGATELLYRTNHMQGKGLVGNLHLKWNDLITFKEEMIKNIPEEHETEFAKCKIDTYHGVVSFSGTHEVLIDEKRVSFKNALIATGAVPRKLHIPGENHIITSEYLLSIRELPKRILFIGGGYISMEFAHIIAASGTQVTILEQFSSPLQKFDYDLVRMLVSETKNRDITVRTNVKLLGIEKSENEYLVITDGEGKDSLFQTDLVVHGAGRVPDIHRLHLEKAGIDFDATRIRVNQFLQSVSHNNIYVAGDAHDGGVQLTPVAEMEGVIVGRNLLEGNRHVPDYSVVPSVVFTFPDIGAVGETVKENTVHDDIEVLFQDTSSKKITKRLGLDVSAFKILLDKKNRRIRGAHLLGYNVDEVINFFALSIQSGLTIDEIKCRPWAYPSVTYDTLFRM